MREHDAERIFEELKEEHLRALEAGDLEALQRVQEKLDALTGRERQHGKAVMSHTQVRTADRGLSTWLFGALAAVVALFSIGYMLS